jgi:hypothetical protein
LANTSDSTGLIASPNVSHGPMYGHGFATLFLAEVYGMTQREEIRDKLRLAIRLIVNTQSRVKGHKGGWRYMPVPRDADLSVTICQVMALRAARNVGIHVPYSVIKRSVDYVRRSAVTVRDVRQARFQSLGAYGNAVEMGGFKYQLDTQGTPHRVTYSLTAAGVTTLLGAGRYDHELVERGLDYMRRNENSINGDPGHYFFFYGHYYAAQAYFTSGDLERWRRYFKRVRTILLESQTREGHWLNHTGPGHVFSTAVATLILEIPYGYLPIFQR